MTIHRSTTVALILISSVYLLLFIPPNLTGAKDPNMLAAFRAELPEYGTDERAQFAVLEQMTRPETSLYVTLRNLLIYEYYTYGYTFFITSMLAILPLKLVYNLFGGNSATTAYMVVLRELSAVLTVAAIILLVYLWTGFRSVVKSLLLFILLGSIPAVFLNNMFWHPDSLVALFVVLTIFSLATDDLRFGTLFYLAAVFCGLATGTKVIGLFFFLSVAVYLMLGLTHRKLRLTSCLKYGVIFFAVMVMTVVISNPMLLIPTVARGYVSKLTLLAQLNAWGWDRERATGPLSWYTEQGPGGMLASREALGLWWMYALVLFVSILGIVYNREKRILNIMILTWAFPISLYFVFFVGFKASHYFIPIFLPMMSCIGNVFTWNSTNTLERKNMPALVLGGASLILCALQLSYYIPIDIDMYSGVLNRENRSASIRFYLQLHDSYLSGLSQKTRLTVLRESKLYLPPVPNWNDNFRGGTFDYRVIEQTKPDLILLSKEVINLHADIAKLSSSYPPDRWQWLNSYPFYHDAQMGSLHGFQKVLETEFAVAFVRAGTTVTQ